MWVTHYLQLRRLILVLFVVDDVELDLEVRLDQVDRLWAASSPYVVIPRSDSLVRLHGHHPQQQQAYFRRSNISTTGAHMNSLDWLCNQPCTPYLDFRRGLGKVTLGWGNRGCMGLE